MSQGCCAISINNTRSVSSNPYRSLTRKLKDQLGSMVASNYSNTSTTVRTIRDEDLDRILDIHKEGFGNKSPDQVILYSRKFRSTFYVCEVDSIIVGYLGNYVHLKREGWKIVPVAIAYSSAVGQDVRGKGIYTLMYKESVSQLKRNGVKAIYSYIRVDNVPALATHQKLGFRIIEEIQNLYGTGTGYKVELKL